MAYRPSGPWRGAFRRARHLPASTFTVHTYGSYGQTRVDLRVCPATWLPRALSHAAACHLHKCTPVGAPWKAQNGPAATIAAGPLVRPAPGSYAPPPICVATRVWERLPRSEGRVELPAPVELSGGMVEPSRTAGMEPSSSQA